MSATALTEQCGSCSSCSRPIDRWCCCSTICTGAMEHRSSFWEHSFGVDRTPASWWRWLFAPRRRPVRLSAAVTASVVRRIGLAQLSEAQATLLLGELDARRSAAIYKQGGGNPFYLEQLARAGQGATLERARIGYCSGRCRRASRRRRVACRRAYVSLRHGSACCSRPPLWPENPFEPDLAATIAEVSAAGGARRARCTCSRGISSARRLYRAGLCFAIPSCGGRSTSRLWVAGDSGARAGCGRACCARRRRPASGPTMSSSRPSRGNEGAIRAVAGGRRGRGATSSCGGGSLVPGDAATAPRS